LKAVIDDGMADQAGDQRLGQARLSSYFCEGARSRERDGFRNLIAHDSVEANVVVVLLPHVSLFQRRLVVSALETRSVKNQLTFHAFHLKSSTGPNARLARSWAALSSFNLDS
jgi:hypothetical protein